jgi:predicted RNase H-like nuclease (RuvC/YqgF family)
MNTELQQRAAHIESLQHAMQDLKCQIDQKDDKIKDFKREAEDLRTRSYIQSTPIKILAVIEEIKYSSQ